MILIFITNLFTRFLKEKRKLDLDYIFTPYVKKINELLDDNSKEYYNKNIMILKFLN